MKKIALLSLFILLSASLYAKDYHKTEEMINNILNEENEASAIKDEKAKQAQAEIKSDAEAEEEKGAADTGENKTAGEEGQDEKKIAMTEKDEVILKTGIQLFESGMYDEALVRFNDLIKNHPSSKFIDSARIWAGKIHIRKYQYDEAVKEFGNVSEKSGEYPAALYYKAESLRIKGDYTGAIENYQKVSSTYPENELSDKSILMTGKLFLNSGKGYQALESALKIVRYYKERETIDDAYYLVAKIYEKDPLLKDVEISRKFYRNFIKKAQNKQKHFADSPLLDAVKQDLRHLEKNYFNLER